MAMSAIDFMALERPGPLEQGVDAVEVVIRTSLLAASCSSAGRSVSVNDPAIPSSRVGAGATGGLGLSSPTGTSACSPDFSGATCGKNSLLWLRVYSA